MMWEPPRPVTGILLPSTFYRSYDGGIDHKPVNGAQVVQQFGFLFKPLFLSRRSSREGDTIALKLLQFLSYNMKYLRVYYWFVILHIGSITADWKAHAVEGVAKETLTAVVLFLHSLLNS
jgi:hypothetical protein